MGDRVDVVLYQDAGEVPVVIYSHWDGSEAETIVARALDRGRSRWDDTPYLARIIFSEFIQYSVLDDTGYGLSTVPGAGDKRITVQMFDNTVDGMSYSDYIEGYLLEN